jgi:hypothetical protein
MRFYFLSTLIFIACTSIPNRYQKEQNYYFFFEEIDNKMRSYHNLQKHKKSYTYILDKADNVLFIVKKKNDKFLERTIEQKDTIGLGIKTCDWLNKFDNTRRDMFFNHKPSKNFFIIEKDDVTGMLNLIEVNFIDEIE